MKKIIFLLVVAAPLALMAQSGKYTVAGKIGSLSSPAKIYLYYFPNDENKIVDSTDLKNGSFKFEGNISSPVRVNLRLNHDGIGGGHTTADYISLFLEANTLIKVSSRDSAKNATVKGSKLTNDLHKLNLALNPATNKDEAWVAEYKAETRKKDPAIMAALFKKLESIRLEADELRKNFILENPGTFVSLYALEVYGGAAPKYAEASALFLSLSEELRNSKTGQEYAAKLEKLRLTSLGAYAPEFTQNDPNGTPVSLKSFRGKYVLIDFWASWCVPCRAENPNVVKAYQQFKDKNFTVLSVSLEKPNGKEAWLKAIAADKLEWTHVSDLSYFKNAVALQYGIESIPQNFLVGPDGKIVAKNIRGEELEKKLSEILQ